MEIFCASAEKLAKLTLELCALGLGLDPSTFGKHGEQSQSTARLNYYPACPTPALTLGLGAHRDPFTLTLLHQCQVGGLQVCKDGNWMTVKPRRGAFVVNVGDNLQVFSILNVSLRVKSCMEFLTESMILLFLNTTSEWYICTLDFLHYSMFRYLDWSCGKYLSRQVFCL